MYIVSFESKKKCKNKQNLDTSSTNSFTKSIFPRCLIQNKQQIISQNALKLKHKLKTYANNSESIENHRIHVKAFNWIL